MQLSAACVWSLADLLIPLEGTIVRFCFSENMPRVMQPKIWLDKDLKLLECDFCAPRNLILHAVNKLRCCLPSTGPYSL